MLLTEEMLARVYSRDGSNRMNAGHRSNATNRWDVCNSMNVRRSRDSAREECQQEQGSGKI
jgi:hypothetical protein